MDYPEMIMRLCGPRVWFRRASKDLINMRDNPSLRMVNAMEGSE